MVIHKHHIVPRHMGGSDDPSNLVEVSIEEHSELHFDLYLRYGRWQDYVAYHMLSGMKEEGMEELYKQNAEYMRNRVVSKETREKMRNNVAHLQSPESRKKRSQTIMGENNHFYGKTHSKETREACRQAAKEQWRKTKYIWVNNGEVSKRVPPDQIPEGFVRGRCKNINKDK